MQKGLSLLEVTIVMVIIGLLIGGIMFGREMMRAADIRGMQNEVAKYSASITLFRGKMGSMPGDLKNASSYWPTATNGDGNGKIGYNNGLIAEEYYAWHHLWLANLLSGGSYAYNGDPRNTPKSVLSGGYYRMPYQSNIYTTSGHMISINAMNTTTSTANKPILSPNEVKALDQKSDDGLADSGLILGFNEDLVPGCVTNDYTAGSGSYLTGTDIKCKAFFVLEH